MGVVSEYIADELAEDSDDEKRLKKAERAAERKGRKRKVDRKQRPPAMSHPITDMPPSAMHLPPLFPSAHCCSPQRIGQWDRALHVVT